MSAGDYISLKKSKMLQNYAPILSSGNKAIANYDQYVRKLALNTVIDSCSKDFYGDDEEKAMNDISINCETYPANTFDGILRPTPLSFIPNTNVGLTFKVCDGNGTITVENSYVNPTSDFFSTEALSSGTATSISDLSFGTNGFLNASGNTDSNVPFAVEWEGYFFCTQTGSWTFTMETSVRDYSFFWIGPQAESGYNISNTFIRHDRNGGINSDQTETISNSFNMTVQTYYKMRIQYNQPTGNQFLSLSFTDPAGNTTFDGTKNYFKENSLSFNFIKFPLKSTPSVPAKLQQACYRGEQPCTTFIHAKRAYHISNAHRRQWNLKKKEMLQISDSTTYKM